MPSNVIIFVVFATVSQGVFVPSSAVSGELPKEVLETLNQTKSNQREVIFSEKSAVNYIFNTLVNLETRMLEDTRYTDQDLSAVMEKGLSSATKSMDYTFNSFLLVLVEPCAAIETGRNASYAYLKKIFDAFEVAIKSVKGGDYPESQAVIDNCKNESRNGFASLSATIYNTMHSCLNTDSRADFKAVIQKAEDGTRKSFDNINNAVYAAMELYAAHFSDKNSSEGENVRVSIESRRLDAWEGNSRHAEFFFGSLEACYITAYLGIPGLVGDLFMFRYNLHFSTNTFKEAAGIVFASLGYLIESLFSVKEDNNVYYYPQASATSARAIWILQNGTDPYYNTVLATQPTSAAKVAAARLVSPFPTVITIDSYYTSMALVQNAGLLCFTTPAAIQAINDGQNAASAPVIITITVVTTGNNASFLIEHIPEVESLQTKAINNVFETNNKIHGAIKYVNDRFCEKKGFTQANFAEIRVQEEEGLAFLGDYVENEYDMALTEFLAGHLPN